MWQVSPEDKELRLLISTVYSEAFPVDGLYELDERSNRLSRLEKIQMLEDLELEEFFRDQGESVFRLLCHLAFEQGRVLAPLDRATELFFRFCMPQAYRIDEALARDYLFGFVPSHPSWKTEGASGCLQEGRCVSLSAGKGYILERLLKTGEVDHVVIASYSDSNRQFSLFNTTSSILIENTIDFTQIVAAVRCDSEPFVSFSAEESARALALHKVLRAFMFSGIGQRVLELSVEYTKNRKQFNVPVAGFQAVQHALSEVCLRTESMLALAELAAIYGEEGNAQLSVAADAAVRYAHEHILSAIEKCIQVHGGTAFTWDYPLHHFLRRALFLLKTQALPGVSEALNQLSRNSQKA